MKNSSKIRFLVLALTLTMILSLVACGKSRTSIVGTGAATMERKSLFLIKMVLVLSRLLMMVVGGKAATAILLMMMGRWF